MTTQGNVLMRKPGASNSRIVVFVHGFLGSSQETWGEFPKLLNADTDLNHFDIFLWSYPSAILGRNPDVRLLGDQLKTELNERLRDYKSIYLIGHSLGGLVIQSMVIEQLKAGHASTLSRIQHIVLFGTPSQGVQVPEILGMVNKQLYDIRITSDTVEELRTAWIQSCLCTDNQAWRPKLQIAYSCYTRCGTRRQTCARKFGA